MSLLLWLARLLSSTVSVAVNLVVSAGLFLLSALLASLADEDAVVVGSVVRGIASIWLWVATWQYVVRGVLQRPPAARGAQKKKTTGLPAALGMLGCLGSLVGIAVVYVAVGPWADWAFAGMAGDDPGHPVRVLADRALSTLEAAAQRPESFVGYFVVAVFAFVGLQLMSAWANRQRRPGQQQAARTGQATDSAGAPRRSTTPPAAPARSSLDDLALGRLTWATREGHWRMAEPRGGIGGLVIETGGTQPSEEQLVLARGIVQRGFEVLLRGSEAARSSAQANGLALPRFTIAQAIVHAHEGRAPAVTLTLQAEGDATRTYAVRSSDGMGTFTLM